jgi:hypothetical protein
MIGGRLGGVENLRKEPQMTDFLPKVSILIPSFNHELFVRQAVQSVLEQTFESIEVIVVDDASTDETVKIVHGIEDQRLSLFRNPMNRSQHPRNRALVLARGKYIAFQNSDDVWMPQKLEKQIALMEGDDSIVACFTQTSFIDDESRESDGAWAANAFDVTDRPAKDWLRRFFDHGNCLPLPTAVVRRDTLTKIGGFSETLIQLSDFDLWVRLATMGTFRCVPEQLVQLRIDTQRNLSAPGTSSHQRSAREFISVLMRYAEPAAINMFADVFPDLPQHPSPCVKLATLARYAMTKSNAHKFFADLLIERLFNCAENRQQITEALGVEVYQSFVESRRFLHYRWDQ